MGTLLTRLWKFYGFVVHVEQPPDDAPESAQEENGASGNPNNEEEEIVAVGGCGAADDSVQNPAGAVEENLQQDIVAEEQAMDVEEEEEEEEEEGMEAEEEEEEEEEEEDAEEEEDEALTKRDRKWRNKFNELKAYKSMNRDCNMPRRYTANPQLASWVHDQRTAKKKGKLANERVQLLEGIGFEWNVLQTSWNQHFNELEVYKALKGDCNVPKRYAENPQLGFWVGRQRKAKNKGKLATERVQLLEGIGFEWDIQVPWEDRFEELKAYKALRSNCIVPRGYAANPQLASWVHDQRMAKKKGKLLNARVRLLEGIGFEWDIQVPWEDRFKQLKAYKAVKGDCNVPQQYTENPQLGEWVKKQRTRKGNLSEEKVKQLDAVGFQWNVRKRHRQEEIKTCPRNKQRRAAS